jgi:hypothetical protein
MLWPEREIKNVKMKLLLGLGGRASADKERARKLRLSLQNC